MFVLNELEQTLKLHRYSYAMLRWVNQALEDKTLKFSAAHRILSIQDATEDWVRRNLNQIPNDFRPEESEISAFSHLFASYLTSSFEIKENPGTKLGGDGCSCSWCRYWVPENHLQPKKLTENAPRAAYHLKKLYLEKLAEDIGAAPSKVEMILKDAESAESVTLATYADDLLRRTKEAGRGEGVLYLWRRIAWTKTAPKKNFKLSAKTILAAEKLLVQKLTRTRP